MEDHSHIEVVKCQYPRKRIGRPFDGGYVICDIPGVKYDFFISGGISDDISFEEAFLKLHDIPCVAFDGTEHFKKEAFPDANPRIEFINKNIGSINSSSLTNLKEYFNDSAYSNIFMKLDIEGGEAELFSVLSQYDLKKIRQLVIEFHSCYQKAIPVMLSKTHWLVHLHPNNCCGVGPNGIPNVFECTYILKTPGDSIGKSDGPIPDPVLDMPNVWDTPDIFKLNGKYRQSSSNERNSHLLSFMKRVGRR